MNKKKEYKKIIENSEEEIKEKKLVFKLEFINNCDE